MKLADALTAATEKGAKITHGGLPAGAFVYRHPDRAGLYMSAPAPAEGHPPTVRPWTSTRADADANWRLLKDD